MNPSDCHRESEERSDVAIHREFQLDCPARRAGRAMTNKECSAESGRLRQSLGEPAVASRSRFGSFAMINTPPAHHSASAFTAGALPASRGTSCTTMRWVAPAPTATSKPTMRVPGFGASVAAGGGSVG